MAAPQGKHICCWERENPHQCILCCQCGKQFVPPMDPASAGCKNWDDHDFGKVYYGDECRKCRLFFAFGCAPWDEE